MSSIKVSIDIEISTLRLPHTLFERAFKTDLINDIEATMSILQYESFVQYTTDRNTQSTSTAINELWNVCHFEFYVLCMREC